MKQELSARLSGENDLIAMKWHPEDPLQLNLITKSKSTHLSSFVLVCWPYTDASSSDTIELFTLCWDTFISTRPPPLDDGTVAVVDGTDLKLTPFRLVNIPPPMSAITLPISTSSTQKTTPVHVAFSQESQVFVALFPDGLIEVWQWELDVGIKGREELPKPFMKWHQKVEGVNTFARQCTIVERNGQVFVGALRSVGDGEDELVIVRQGEAEVVVKIMERANKLINGQDEFILESKDGVILTGELIEPEKYQNANLAVSQSLLMRQEMTSLSLQNLFLLFQNSVPISITSLQHQHTRLLF